MRPSSDKEAITLIVDGLLTGGVVLTYVHDGEERVSVETTAEAVSAITAVDEATLVVNLPDGQRGWIWFVLGNEPEEVASDYTVNLTSLLDPITDPWWER